MGLFGALVRTAVNVATLPVAVVKDVVAAPFDYMENKPVGARTAKNLQAIKDEATE